MSWKPRNSFELCSLHTLCTFIRMNELKKEMKIEMKRMEYIYTLTLSVTIQRYIKLLIALQVTNITPTDYIL